MFARYLQHSVRLVLSVVVALYLVAGALPAHGQDALDPLPVSGKSGIASLLGADGKFLPNILPPCLRTVDEAASADFDCVTDAIVYYINLLLAATAIVAFFYMLYGGYLYTTAFGDENKVKTAKGVIKYALIGIILATLAVFIVQLLQSVLNVQSVPKT